jgi:hypothetical protein
LIAVSFVSLSNKKAYYGYPKFSSGYTWRRARHSGAYRHHWLFTSLSPGCNITSIILGIAEREAMCDDRIA